MFHIVQGNCAACAGHRIGRGAIFDAIGKAGKRDNIIPRPAINSGGISGTTASSHSEYLCGICYGWTRANRDRDCGCAACNIFNTDKGIGASQRAIRLDFRDCPRAIIITISAAILDNLDCPASIIHNIRAVPAIDTVITCAGDKDIITVPANQGIIAVPADQQIRMGRADKVLNIKQHIACRMAARTAILSRIAQRQIDIDPCNDRAICQSIGCNAMFGIGIHAQRACPHHRIRRYIGSGIIPRPAIKGICPGAACQDIIARAASQRVITRPAGQNIITLAAIQGIAAVPAGQDIRAIPAIQGIRAIPAYQGILAITPDKGIITRPAGQTVIPVIPDQHIGMGRAKQIFNAGQRVACGMSGCVAILILGIGCAVPITIQRQIDIDPVNIRDIGIHAIGGIGRNCP